MAIEKAIKAIGRAASLGIAMAAIPPGSDLGRLIRAAIEIHAEQERERIRAANETKTLLEIAKIIGPEC